MASSLKVSELNSLNQLTDNDLFLVSDVETSTSRKVTYSTLKNNVTSQLAGTVAQNRQDAETLVETIRAALQLAIDGNTSYSTETRSSLITTSEELQQGIDNLRSYLNSDMWLFSNQSEFPSPSENHGRVVHSHADGAMFYAHAGQWIELSTKLFVDGLDTRITSVEGTTSQNSTDIAALQTTVDNLDIDIAPETLNSINELSEALGDDPQIITNLQAELTAYKAHIEERNLELALAFDVPTYAEIIYGG